MARHVYAVPKVRAGRQDPASLHEYDDIPVRTAQDNFPLKTTHVLVVIPVHALRLAGDIRQGECRHHGFFVPHRGESDTDDQFISQQ
eukprot:3639671-Rhodomonas_salina.2